MVLRKHYELPLPNDPPPREPRLLTLPRYDDRRGTLCVADWPECVPFTPSRCYYICNVPSGTMRAGHAHFVDRELIVCLTGSVVVLTDDGQTRQDFCLSSPDMALYIPPLVWHELRDFSPGTVCTVLAAEKHSEKDCCRVYQEFRDAARQSPR